MENATLLHLSISSLLIISFPAACFAYFCSFDTSYKGTDLSDEFSAEKITIYPTVVDDYLYICSPNESNAVTTVQIINSMGQTVKSLTLGANERSVKLSGLSAGLYAVIVKSDTQVVGFKVIKK